LTGPRRTREGLPLHERALGLLAVRERSRRELSDRLVQAGFDPEDVAEELDRLQAAGLVDDRRFAAGFAEEAARRLRGARAVSSSLAAKGVERGVIAEAVAGLRGSDEERALELARTRAHRLASLPAETAYRRLEGFLARRGYEPALARWAARRALGLES
jgi:regulatory protein